MAASIKIKLLPKISLGVVDPVTTRVTIGLLNKIELVVIEPTAAAATATLRRLMGVGR